MNNTSDYSVEVFRRPLESLAYRMLGSTSDAQDIAQEALIKWYSLEAKEWEEIKSAKSWLFKVASRMALDKLRSAQHRRETYVGPWLPEPWLMDEHSPADSAAKADSITFALMLLLERLNPQERAAFILHDVFAFSFNEVGEILEKAPANCRQLASRAREAIKAEQTRYDLTAETHEKLLNAFMEATKEGNVDALKVLLAEDVVIYSDGGGLVPAARKVLKSQDIVARLFMGVGRKKQKRGIVMTTAIRHINGLPTILLYEDGRLTTLMGLSVKDGKIQTIYQQRNPEKLKSVVAR